MAKIYISELLTEKAINVVEDGEIIISTYECTGTNHTGKIYRFYYKSIRQTFGIIDFVYSTPFYNPEEI